MVAFEMLITFPARLNNYPDMQIKFPVNFLGKSPVTHCDHISIMGENS